MQALARCAEYLVLGVAPGLWEARASITASSAKLGSMLNCPSSSGCMTAAALGLTEYSNGLHTCKWYTAAVVGHCSAALHCVYAAQHQSLIVALICV